MAGTASVFSLLGYLVLGLAVGWGVLVIRDDIRIRKDNQWRRMRAVLLAGFCIVFAIALLFVNSLGFLAFSSGCVVVLACALRKK